MIPYAHDDIANTTRFFILANSLDVVLPGNIREIRRQRVFVRISNKLQYSKDDGHPSSTHLTRMTTSTLLTTFGCPALRIDRRPSLNQIPFDDVYFIELGDLTLPVSPNTETSSEEGWLQRVKSGVKVVESAGGEGVIIGLW